VSDNDAKFLTAVITAIVSLGVALFGYVATRRNQRDVEQLKAILAEQKAERDARRDYEYEARKRLYRECGPLFFQLSELSEIALNRIRSLARTARQGNLEPGPSSWLHANVDDANPAAWMYRNYFWLSTYYRVLAPLAVLRLLQARLTHIDLSLDVTNYVRYSLAKQAYFAFADDFRLANLSRPPLPYDPHSPEAADRRWGQPETYWQQGVPLGILDGAVECLTVGGSTEVGRVMSFGEFQGAYVPAESPTRRALDRIGYLFDEFHPATRPVLWRILLTQANLYTALLRSVGAAELTSEEGWQRIISAEERPDFDWRRSQDSDDQSIVSEPFGVSAQYLARQLDVALGRL
jgi:hypothetical protein